MLDLMISSLNVKTMTMVFAAIAAAATILTIAMPYAFGDALGQRMKAVAIEREKIRARERERMAQQSQKVNLRQAPKESIKAIVDRFNLTKWVGQEEARLKLVQAGYRGQAPYVTYMFFLGNYDLPASIKIGICIAAAYLGMHLPWMMLKSKIQKRQLSIKRAFPDTLDLLLICVESGMSIETAFRKVSVEIVTQSVALSEEFT